MRTIKPVSLRDTHGLSSTKEDYLRAIYLLQKTEPNGVRSRDIVKALGLSKSTVSERLSELVGLKLIKTEPYSEVRLTEKGYEIAKRLTYRHRVIEVFLHTILQFPKDELHKQANALEHAFSDEAIKRLADYLGNPQKDPHGVLIEP